MRIDVEGFGSAAAGTVDEAFCGICGDRCAIRRNVMGPTSFGEAMAKRRHLHDAIACPNNQTEWHDRIGRLRQAIADSPSPSVAALMASDLAVLLVQRAVVRKQ